MKTQDTEKKFDPKHLAAQAAPPPMGEAAALPHAATTNAPTHTAAQAVAPPLHQSSSGGLGDVLGEVLGGAPGAQQSSGGLGDILGEVLGGAQSSSPAYTQNSAEAEKKKRTRDIILLICTLGFWYFRMKKRGQS